MVLILVVMKDTNCKNVEREIDVLILIIMEDTHGVEVIAILLTPTIVLILIIMEDTHGVNKILFVSC